MFSQVQEQRSRESASRVAIITLQNFDDSLRLGIRQRTKEQRIRNTEDSGTGANAQGKQGNAYNRIQWILTEYPQRKNQIFRNMVHTFALLYAWRRISLSP